MASSRADWVFGDARLISSPSTTLAKTPPGRKVNDAGLPVVHAGAGHVGGQQVGRELDPPPLQVERAGQRLGQAGLAHARHVLEQQVALGGQAHQGQPGRVLLALQDLGHVVDDRLEGLGKGADGLAPTAGCLAIGPPETVWRLAYLARNDFISRRRWTERPTESVLAVDIGGTKLAVGLVDRHGQLGWAAQVPTPAGDAETIWSALDRLAGGRAAGPAGGVRDRLRRAHVGRRRAGVAAQHPGLAGLSPAGPGGRADRPAHLDRQRRQSPGARRRVGGRGGRDRQLPLDGGLDRRSAAASSSTAGCSTGTTATPDISATWSSSPTAGGARAGVKVPGGRGVRDGHRRHHRPIAGRGRPGGRGPDRDAGRPGGGQRWPTCSTSSWPRSAARWRWASANRSSPRPGRAGGPGPPAVLAELPHRPQPPGAGRAADRRRRRWAGGASTRIDRSRDDRMGRILERMSGGARPGRSAAGRGGPARACGRARPDWRRRAGGGAGRPVRCRRPSTSASGPRPCTATSGRLDPADLVAYLEWCRRMGPQAR